jgi:hypothetical protein
MRSIVNRPIAIVTGVGTALSCAIAVAIACGPFLTDLETVTATHPADRSRYASGELGIVRPRFERRHLLQAYRVMTGRGPLQMIDAPDATIAPGATTAPETPVEEWFAIAGGPPPGFSQERDAGDYQFITNCPDAAFAQALRTYRARAAQFGARSEELKGWVAAQSTVFANCSGPLALPPEAAPTATALVRADRAYQAAAAHFYAMDYLEAEKRFRAIAAEPSSPWRPLGRYLAARANIRQATVREKDDALLRSRLVTAEADLRATLADPEASALHASARGLLEFVAARLQPVERLHALTRTLLGSAPVAAQDLTDYVRLMDAFVGNTVTYDLGAVAQRTALVADDDVTAWILTMQATEPDLDGAIARWRRDRAVPWLVALLWRIPPQHRAAGELLEAAAALDSRSPAHATAAFLRARLLAQRGDADAARTVLATLPDAPAPGFPPETVNLIKAERFALARSLEELLANAPRASVVPLDNLPDSAAAAMPVFDFDAGYVLTHRLPLERLVVAAESAALPDRLRTRVAAAAFARGVVLKQEPAALRAVAVLRRVAPDLTRDFDEYANAGDAAARHRAGVLVLLRTPGLHTYVRGLDNDRTIASRGLDRQFDHMFRLNWWCAESEAYAALPSTELTTLMYPDRTVPFPAFLTADERRQAEVESTTLAAAGSGRAYLAAETLAWARTDPRNPSVAEALAQVVEGWRWGCGDDARWPLARQAFTVLHASFPQSEWARRTKYWYRD